MTKTENYQLNQWVPEDRVIRTDFNEDNAKIDIALKTQADAITAEVSARKTAVAAEIQARQAAVAAETQARQEAVAAVQNVAGNAYSPSYKPYVAGYYQGDGAATQTITLGFTPSVVFVVCSTSEMTSTSYRLGGLAIPGHANDGGVSLVTGGFRVSFGGAAHTNVSGKYYHYIAFR